MIEVPPHRRRSLGAILLSLLSALLGIGLIVPGTILCRAGISAAINAEIDHKATAGAISLAIAVGGGFLVIVGLGVIVFGVIVLAWILQRPKG